MSVQSSKHAIIRGQAVELQPRKGDPNIMMRQYFDASRGGHLMGFTTASHNKGAECGRHNHRGADEMFRVVSGKGRIVVNDATYDVIAGDVVIAVAGAYHNLIGVSDEPFVVDCTFVRAQGHESDPTPWVGTA